MFWLEKILYWPRVPPIWNLVLYTTSNYVDLKVRCTCNYIKMIFKKYIFNIFNKAHTTGTTEAIHTAEILIVSRKENLDSAIPKSKYFFLKVTTKCFAFYYLMFIP